jgi:O-antigen/teichoic acid export membrane protein
MPKELDSLKVITKGAAIVFFGLLVSKVITYFFVMFAARYFGPEPYGVFSLGVAITSFLSLVFLLGLPKGIVRYISFFEAKEEKEKIKGVITSSLKISSILSIFVFIMMFLLSDQIAAFFSEPRLSMAIKIFSVSLPFLSVGTVLSSVLRGFKRNDYDVISMNITNNIFSLMFIVVFWYLGFTIYGIPIGWTIGTAVAFFMASFFVRKIYSFSSPIKSAHISRELIVFSLPLLLVSAMWMLISWTDTLMLGFFDTTHNVGIYNVALPTARLLYVIPIAFTTIFLPVASGLFSTGRTEEMKSIYRIVTKWIFYLMFPAVLIFSLFSRQIINIFFGANYISGNVSLIVLSAGFFVLAILSISNNILITMKKTKTVAFHTIAAAVLNVTLNALLIPVYGIYGAAIATASSFVLWRLLDLINAYKYTRFNPFSFYIIKSVVAGLLSIAIIYMLSRVLYAYLSIYLIVILFVLFLFIYLLLLVLFRGFEKDDIEIMKFLENKIGVRVRFIRKFIEKFVGNSD